MHKEAQWNIKEFNLPYSEYLTWRKRKSYPCECWWYFLFIASVLKSGLKRSTQWIESLEGDSHKNTRADCGIVLWMPRTVSLAGCEENKIINKLPQTVKVTMNLPNLTWCAHAPAEWESVLNNVKGFRPGWPYRSSSDAVGLWSLAIKVSSWRLSRWLRGYKYLLLKSAPQVWWAKTNPRTHSELVVAVQVGRMAGGTASSKPAWVV